MGIRPEEKWSIPGVKGSHLFIKIEHADLRDKTLKREPNIWKENKYRFIFRGSDFVFPATAPQLQSIQNNITSLNVIINFTGKSC